MSYRASIAMVLVALGAALMPAHSTDQQSLNHQLLQDASLSSAFGVEKVQQDLTNGAEMNASDKDVKTALMVAAYNIEGKPEVVRMLLEHDANVNAKDNGGETALMMAVQNKNMEVVNLLLAHRANATLMDKHSHTALEYAYLGGGGKIAELISGHLPRRSAPVAAQVQGIWTRTFLGRCSTASPPASLETGDRSSRPIMCRSILP